MSFLIVDDNQVMRRAIKRIACEFTGEIVECDDGAFAFAAYEKHLPEWVLMDVEMARTDGLTATREICAAYPAARVVIVTKYSDAEMREAAARAGAIGYVMKENLLELRGILSRKAN
ncbi:MAG: response regulator transcription factor [Acidobacteriota bacterium]|nr:response regulator transcription factor [Acidobacteriota bacterium]